MTDTDRNPDPHAAPDDDASPLQGGAAVGGAAGGVATPEDGVELPAPPSGSVGATADSTDAGSTDDDVTDVDALTDADPSTLEDDLDPELRAAEDPRTPGQLLVALEEAAATRDDYLDALQRSRAEFDNYRRRTTREAASARRAGVGDLAASLLEVLDDLDRTAEVAKGSRDEGLAAGIDAVHRKLVDALVAAGIRRIDEVDVPFDATLHEAVQQVPADPPVPEPQVAQVLRPGYLHDDRCLRAAMVVVRQ